MFMWLFTLILSMAVPLLYAFILLVIFWKYHRYTWAFLLLGLVYVGFSYSPHVVNPPIKTAGYHRVAFLNARIIETNLHAQSQAIAALNADVVAIVEARSSWQQAAIRQQFPYHLYTQTNLEDDSRTYQDGYFLLSKWPITQQNTILGQAVRFYIAAPKPFYVVVAHPLAPLKPAFIQHRNAALKAMAQVDTTPPTLIIGDFNTVPWDPAFWPLVRHPNLHWQGSILPTYKAQLPIIPIDHILTTKSITTKTPRRWTGGESDHYGLVMDFVVE